MSGCVEPDPLLQEFERGSMPSDVWLSVGRPYSELAARLNIVLPPGRERTRALQRLLESSDAALLSCVMPREANGARAQDEKGGPA